MCPVYFRFSPVLRRRGKRGDKGGVEEGLDGGPGVTPGPEWGHKCSTGKDSPGSLPLLCPPPSKSVLKLDAMAAVESLLDVGPVGPNPPTRPWIQSLVASSIGNSAGPRARYRPSRPIRPHPRTLPQEDVP